MPNVDPFKDPLQGPVIIREDEGPKRGRIEAAVDIKNFFGLANPAHASYSGTPVTAGKVAGCPACGAGS